VAARIYDKTEQLKTSHAAYWEDIWDEAWDRSERVLRIEFEINRTGLKQYRVDSAYDAIKAAPGIWLNLTGKWLRFTTPTADATRSRWPVAPEWLVVQRARIGSDAHGIDRMYAGRKRGDLLAIAPQISGYVAQVAALEGVQSVEDGVASVGQLLRWYEGFKGRSFEDRVAEKRSKLGLG
jgi:hypothetical protein